MELRLLERAADTEERSVTAVKTLVVRVLPLPSVVTSKVWLGVEVVTVTVPASLRCALTEAKEMNRRARAEESLNGILSCLKLRRFSCRKLAGWKMGNLDLQIVKVLVTSWIARSLHETTNCRHGQDKDAKR